MKVSELRNSTAIDKALEINTLSAASKPAAKSLADIPAEKSAQDTVLGGQMTAGGVSKYLHGIAASSCGEIDALIGDLCNLREKLLVDGDRIEQDLVEFTTLNHSVIKLTQVVMDSVTHVKPPPPRE